MKYKKLWKMTLTTSNLMRLRLKIFSMKFWKTKNKLIKLNKILKTLKSKKKYWTQVKKFLTQLRKYVQHKMLK